MRAIGFRYKWDEETKQYAHAAGLMVLTPQGRLARYFYGVEFPARDLRLALVEASANKIGSRVDQILLFCFHYDPSTGKYSLAITRVLRVAGAATVLALAVLMIVLLRRERRGQQPHEGGATG
jgi:protein SCO1/2